MARTDCRNGTSRQQKPINTAFNAAYFHCQPDNPTRIRVFAAIPATDPPTDPPTDPRPTD